MLHLLDTENHRAEKNVGQSDHWDKLLPTELPTLPPVIIVNTLKPQSLEEDNAAHEWAAKRPSAYKSCDTSR